MRLLHVSDLHLEDGFSQVPLSRFLNKRTIGWFNLRLRRAKYYRDAADKVRALARFIESERIDAVLCSGDYTALGTPQELAFARRTVAPLTGAPHGFVTVPGNHDVYLEDSLGVFAREFSELLTSDLPELQVDGHWPLVRFVGDEIAVVCVDSARPNPPVLRSSGRIPDVQLTALSSALSHPKVRDRFVIVMTHYAPRLVSGRPDTPSHGLENADAFLDVCNAAERGIIIHGHVHKRFTVRVPESDLRLCGAGSTTQAGREGLWMYEIDESQALGTPGTFVGEDYELLPSESVDLLS